MGAVRASAIWLPVANDQGGFLTVNSFRSHFEMRKS
jgi:hypothetical protein